MSCRCLPVCALVLAGAAAVQMAPPIAASMTQAGERRMAPRFEVDPYWPKPLPRHWILGSTIGLAVDARGHVFILHRQSSIDDDFKAAAVNPPVGVCCTPAPPVLEFDAGGNLVNSWGGPGQGYDWPVREHGLSLDHKGNVWIGGNDDKDSHILKFTRDGRFLLQIGRPGQKKGSNDPENFWRPAKVFVEPAANEAYVADGYGNRRVIVLDADTGRYKRHWGAYGAVPDDAPVPEYSPAAPPSRQFNTVHCAMVSNDGFVYVCDRVNDRIQVFRTDGTYVKEAFYDRNTRRSGSVWDMTFSRDSAQRYLYVADGVNEKIRIVDRRTLEVLTSFGDGGRQPGQFYGVHNLATDSHGNLYTTETYSGARVQRFVFKGERPVDKVEQGVPWPRR
jgi:DNA-binding beta-propeller fold protein YncE